MSTNFAESVDTINKDLPMKQYICEVCGWIYSEAQGWPEEGIAPGTKFEDIPEDWYCPECGVSKMDFIEYEQ